MLHLMEVSLRVTARTILARSCILGSSKHTHVIAADALIPNVILRLFSNVFEIKLRNLAAHNFCSNSGLFVYMNVT